MDEKEAEKIDINGIASAVAAAVGKLNLPKESEEKEKEKSGESETFDCPECGSKVSARAKYCPGCGCELEWEE